MITGLTANSFDNLQLDAGILIKGFSFDSATNAATLKTAIASAIEAGNCLGATRGGGSFTCTPKTHEVDADGKRYAFKGGTRVDGYDIKLSTTLIETTPDNFKIALGAADIETTGQKSHVKLRTDIKDSDYISNICWIGDTSKGGVMVICLKNALNVGGVTFTYTDMGEGTLPIEFVAHQDDVNDYDLAPVDIYWFKPAT